MDASRLASAMPESARRPHPVRTRASAERPPREPERPAGPGRAARLARAARRQWWVVVLVAALGAAGGYGATRIESPTYQATTDVLVTPATPGDATPNLATEVQLVTSTGVASQAAALLKVGTAPAVLAGRVRVAARPGSSVLAISYDSATAAAARDGSHAFATAYLDARQGSARADLTAQISTATATLKKQQAALDAANADLAKLRTSSSRYAAESAQRDGLVQQVSTLQSKIDNLAATSVNPGRVIIDATLPSGPAYPSMGLFLGFGGATGLLVGLVLAAIRQRVTRRIRDAVEVGQHGGLRVMAAVPEIGTGELLAAYGSGGLAFNRLRNEALASMGEHGQVIVVTGASRGSAATAVAANLAAALARTGSETVLIGAHSPETMTEAVPLLGMLGVSATPGLGDLLAGTVHLDDAVQRVAAQPWLRAISTGGAASSVGLRPRALQGVLDDLRERAEYVVVDTPSTSSSTDAQSIAAFADAVLVVVELGASTRAEVRDAAEQLRRVFVGAVGAVGAVTVPRCARTAIGTAKASRQAAPLPASIRPMPTARPGTNTGGAPSGRPDETPAGDARRAGTIRWTGVGRQTGMDRQEAMHHNQPRRPAPLRPATPAQPAAKAPMPQASPVDPAPPIATWPIGAQEQQPTVPYAPTVFLETTIEGGGK